jgi:2-aminoethylphosphonate-pyruvate transaminase
MNGRTILLNPGPVTLSERVRAALGRADCCHREKEFAELTRSINRRLVDVYPAARERYAAVMLGGSGTCAVEAMLQSFTDSQGRVLLLANGVYGERMAAILRAAGREVVTIASDWQEPMDLAAAEARLRDDNSISRVLAVHHETTTGRLNAIDRLGQLCKRYRRPLLLDAVSSFAAEDIRFDEWNLLALAATANKCLHGVPGIAFVIAREQALQEDPGTTGSLYLDVRNYYRQQSKDGFSPFTPAVQSAFALDVALDEFFLAGGWQKRRSRYRQIGAEIGAVLATCGVEPLLPDGEGSAAMTAYRLPVGTSYAALHSALKREGFIIYAGQGPLSEQVFRIAHMGDIRDTDVQRLTSALRGFLKRAA